MGCPDYSYSNSPYRTNLMSCSCPAFRSPHLKNTKLSKASQVSSRKAPRIATKGKGKGRSTPAPLREKQIGLRYRHLLSQKKKKKNQTFFSDHEDFLASHTRSKTPC
ncbi:hypothetical protein F5X98DRAFT_311931 [Xylaria grammica]|nr:hypothetical protein F5X98DRAFT_311931 [Xylaria grammica]